MVFLQNKDKSVLCKINKAYITPISQNVAPLYHGSPSELDLIEVHKSNLADNPVVFGTTNPKTAASFIPKWSDKDFERGRWYMREKYPGAFKKLETPGYVHKLDPAHFYRNDKLGSYNEYISDVNQKPLSVKYIPNVRKYIEDFFELVEFKK